MVRIHRHLAIALVVVVFASCRTTSSHQLRSREADAGEITADPVEPMRQAMIAYRCAYGFVSQTGDSYVCIESNKSGYTYSLLYLEKNKKDVVKNATRSTFVRDHDQKGAEHYYFVEEERGSKFTINFIIGKDMSPRLYATSPEALGAEAGPDYTMLHPDLASFGAQESTSK